MALGESDGTADDTLFSNPAEMEAQDSGQTHYNQKRLIRCGSAVGIDVSRRIVPFVSVPFDLHRHRFVPRKVDSLHTGLAADFHQELIVVTLSNHDVE
jgi:hypothetical protein